MKYKLVLAVGLLLGLAVASQGAVQTFGDTVPMTKTNWTDSVTIPLFDPSLGNLLSVEFVLGGSVDGSVMFESLDAAQQDVTTEVKAEITLQRPDLSPIVVATPVASATNTVDAFDGTIDFGGGSGRTLPSIMNSVVESATAPPPASDLALFTGVGNIVLPVSAVGSSSAGSAANLLVVFGTKASADVRVRYTYAPVPEPSSFILAMTSLAGIAGIRRARRGR